MKHLKICLVIACFINTAALAQVTILSTKFNHPESVITDGHYLYVSNIGKAMEPMLKDGDGYITKMTMTGKIIDSSLCKGTLNAPKGMTISNGVLYVADLDRVIGISLKTGSIVRQFDFSRFKTMLLNDITSDGNSVLYVTATDVNKVFSIDMVSDSLNVVQNDVVDANGIVYDKVAHKLYVVGFGAANDQSPTGLLGCIDLNGRMPVYKVISQRKGLYDGVIQIAATTLIVTDWISLSEPKGKLLRVDLTNGKITALNIRPIAGPSDIWYLKQSHSILIPEMLQGSILKLHIN